jgi:hypothetical protein
MNKFKFEDLKIWQKAMGLGEDINLLIAFRRNLK